MDLSIIIVTYNSSQHIVGLLDSIKNSPDQLHKEVIVVDNASSDDTASQVSRHPLHPKLIKSKSNLGFAKGVNLGVKSATGEYLLLLNPDTRLVGNALSFLYKFATTTTPLGAVAPRLLNQDGRPQASVYHFPTIWNAIKKDFFARRNSFGKYLPENRTQKVDVAVMAAFLIPRAIFTSLGGLNEKYFLYYEDFDFCKQLKLHNLPLYYLPSAKVKHAHGQSGHFVFHLKSPLLASSKLYYGSFYSQLLNLVLWFGHKWQVILRGKRFRD